MSTHVFGIRHHGPGSARSLVAALAALEPDIVLVEGPPDAEAVLPLLTHADMRPPVALLIYRPDEPRHAVYYPFTHFSPEWQAIRHGLTRGVPVRFMDLPAANYMALEPPDGVAGVEEAPPGGGAPTISEPEGAGQPDAAVQPDAGSPVAPASESAPGEAPEVATEAAEALPPLREDPLSWLARAAGEEDGERWWERMVEERRDGADLFAAIQEAMAALRAAAPREEPREAELEARREASMRQAIRAAQREGFQRIAVVCGAWHAPALVELSNARADAAVLKGLPKVKVQATWAPWTDERLALASGYGAGIASPGWYDHLWTYPARTAQHWLTRVARLLREQDLDASSAHVIEAVRLAEALAALRGRAQPGLAELTEATRAVLCGGSDTPLRLIHRQLIVGERLGAVPDETPLTPLQADLAREQRRLRLPPEASERALDLDLRQPTDLARSHLLHRLLLLDIPWGAFKGAGGGVSTFHEHWQVRWRPELAVAVIVASRWGTTLAAAATARAEAAAAESQELATLTRLVDRVLLADLPGALDAVMTRLQAIMAVTGDVAHLMDALPPLVNVARYGDVRGQDGARVGPVVDGLVARICIGLPGACASLDDDAAAAMLAAVDAVDGALARLQHAEHLAAWQAVLRWLAEQRALHGLLAGRATRLLLDAGHLAADEAARRLGLALSPAAEPARVAAWVEGFLGGSGQLLLHDEALWRVLDAWVAALAAESFTVVLPLLRRTFARFPASERRQMGERARAAPAARGLDVTAAEAIDLERADAVLPLVARLLGLAGVADEPRSA